MTRAHKLESKQRAGRQWTGEAKVCLSARENQTFLQQNHFSFFCSQRRLTHVGGASLDLSMVY